MQAFGRTGEPRPSGPWRRWGWTTASGRSAYWFCVFLRKFCRTDSGSTFQGGLNARPVMSQFGYQFETAYISNEKVQVLFEFVLSITGLDQGKFLPTLSILNGVRFNKSGWEFIVGPFYIWQKEPKDSFDAEGDWMLLSEYRANNPGEPDPDGTTKAFDARGNFGITSSFLLSIGKNFKAGNINFQLTWSPYHTLKGTGLVCQLGSINRGDLIPATPNFNFIPNFPLIGIFGKVSLRLSRRSSGKTQAQQELGIGSDVGPGKI